MPLDIDTTEYVTSAAAFGSTTLSSLPRHVSQLEKDKIRLERDEAMRARYLPVKSPPAENIEPLDSILRPHVSELERRKQRLQAGDEALSRRYGGRAGEQRRRSALQRELEEAESMPVEHRRTPTLPDAGEEQAT